MRSNIAYSRFFLLYLLLQALIEFSLVGLRCSRVVTQSHDAKTFVTLDRLELTDLLQSEDSPFRIMVSSSNTANANGGFFSSFVGVVPALSWESHKMLVSDWGFQLSSSMETLREAIGYACAPDKFADHSSVQACDFVFRNLSHGNGISYIELSLSHLTAQWNPSTVIALQRFLGRMKKFTTNILTTSAADKNVEIASSNSSKAPESADVIFSVKADIQSISIYLSKYAPYCQSQVSRQQHSPLITIFSFGFPQQTKNINKDVFWIPK